MNSRVITRERGVIPGCRKAGPDSHMAVDGLGRPWLGARPDYGGGWTSAKLDDGLGGA
jgi:hypothetical protein